MHGDATELAVATAERISDDLRRIVGTKGRASLVLSGGSTPLATYRRLATQELPWDRVDLYWGDERCVGPDDPASNFGRVRDALLEPAEVPREVVHRMRGELPPSDGVAHYEEVLRTKFAGSRPVFDLILLGLGVDGHTASLFPGVASGSLGSWVISARAPEPPHERISLSYEALRGGRRTVFLVSGGDKATVVSRILGGAEPRLPAARVAAEAESLIWLVDRDAVPDPAAFVGG